MQGARSGPWRKLISNFHTCVSDLLGRLGWHRCGGRAIPATCTCSTSPTRLKATSRRKWSGEWHFVAHSGVGCGRSFARIRIESLSMLIAHVNNSTPLTRLCEPVLTVINRCDTSLDLLLHGWDGTSFRFNTIGVSDGISMGTAGMSCVLSPCQSITMPLEQGTIAQCRRCNTIH
jgi:hypothetical protein